MKLAKTTSEMKDNNDYPIVQITYLERVVDAAVGNQYGIHSSPDTNTPCLLININGDDANRIIIPLSVKNRTKGLKKGEVETGNFKVGSIIKFDKDGNINITAKKDLNAIIKGNCIINATGQAEITASKLIINNNTEVSGTIDATGKITGSSLSAGDGKTGTYVNPADGKSFIFKDGILIGGTAI